MVLAGVEVEESEVVVVSEAALTPKIDVASPSTLSSAPRLTSTISCRPKKLSNRLA